ncbi:LEAF RUST 10 DISEASE-RESISTANCE LOCUS RECEPTOR-LIKE PROTEIN KINASE 2.1 [Trifolium repens]|nr:LEAF RUST 10 DISEASE-RESISTANCE LOCUS RECEPTOR-LIKE PROTEIN KINASE 2.1 [Trifolium repens]
MQSSHMFSSTPLHLTSNPSSKTLATISDPSMMEFFSPGTVILFLHFKTLKSSTLALETKYASRGSPSMRQEIT